MLSFCVTVKNRSRIRHDGRDIELFPRCVESIRCCAQEMGFSGVELVVADWQSDDWPLAQWIAAASAPVPVKVIRAEGSFSRGRGRNLAASVSCGDHLFFLDADCVVGSEVLSRGFDIASGGGAYFPITYSFDDPAHETGRFRERGYGNCMLPRSVFLASGGWPEFEVWGGEDLLFWSRVTALARGVREKAPALVHQWHPEDLAWKNRFGASTVHAEQERGTGLARTILAHVPENATLLLVRAAQQGLEGLGQRLALPFLERNGVYWGPPRNDDQAVREIERMRELGAGFVVFGWDSFWWLEHYTGFGRHLRRTYTCVAEEADAVVFDVRSPRDDARGTTAAAVRRVGAGGN